MKCIYLEKRAKLQLKQFKIVSFVRIIQGIYFQDTHPYVVYVKSTVTYQQISFFCFLSKYRTYLKRTLIEPVKCHCSIADCLLCACKTATLRIVRDYSNCIRQFVLNQTRNCNKLLYSDSAKSCCVVIPSISHRVDQLS